MAVDQRPGRIWDQIFSYLPREDLLKCRLLNSKLKTAAEKSLSELPEKRKCHFTITALKKQGGAYMCEIEDSSQNKSIFKVVELPILFKIHNIHITQLDLHLFADKIENGEVVRTIVRKQGFSVDGCVVRCYTNNPDWIRRVNLRAMTTGFAKWSIWNEEDPADENRVHQHNYLRRAQITTNFSFNPKYWYSTLLIWRDCVNSRIAPGLYLDGNGQRQKLRFADRLFRFRKVLHQLRRTTRCSRL
ncbi:unnamed protein product [Bursaphelenchus xylophilus]|uniref:(pine wood nematode) hypothetical protein n=1 Tax=Bursaphelenchus xylophilus TaxID=6326 RepID=A0A1I7S9A3_BURXY|nr:unnamed protein product [Bursaphelenchus xylophilus]CAG9100475.1 unnamed protein product [Bursaphelenchus xylophilus]